MMISTRRSIAPQTEQLLRTYISQTNTTTRTMNEKEIQGLMERHAPPGFVDAEPEACDYICSILGDTQSSSSEDDLVNLISHFFNDQGSSEALVADLFSKFIVSDDDKPESPSRAPDPSAHELRRVSLLQELRKDPQLTTDSSSDDSTSNKTFKTKSQERRSKREARKAHRRQRKQETTSAVGDSNHTNDFVDDDVSAWQERQEERRAWGGRGHGGRGVRGDVNTCSNMHLTNITFQFAGNELLQSSTIQVNGGHRYGLIGRNGCGKSVLLQRLAAKAIPGMPQDMRVLLVKQQVDGGPETALEALLGADTERARLLEEQAALEDQIERGIDSTSQLSALVEQLGEAVLELDAIDADNAEDRAKKILRGLQFSSKLMETRTENLSGGWRMRLSLARALFVPSDLLLLDEPTNHLDLHGLLWLSQYLRTSKHTVIVVSHDRNFLDICTDIISFEHKKLHYYVGNYSAYCLQQEEKAARHAQILDASERQRSKVTAFIQKQEASAGKKRQDPKKQRQAKMMKEKKLERIGNYREDGKRYKNRSLAKLSDKHFRMAQKVQIEADEPAVRLNFPDPVYAPGMTPGSPLVRVENLRFGYSRDGPLLLNDLVLDLNRESKIAIVGTNGSGKSTLLKLITGEIDPLEDQYMSAGTIWRHPSLRIGYIGQHSVEELEGFASMTVTEYADKYIRAGKVCARIILSAGGNIRQYLGGFGLGGKLAHRLIGSLSGGERMRLCFAKVLSEEPQLLCMDEVTNHLDLESLDSLSAALNAYSGAVVIVSHNQGFLSGFCKELWVVESRGVDVRHSDTDSFDATFSKYRNEALSDLGSRSDQRQAKSTLVKRAHQQRSGAKQSIGLIF